MPIKAPAPLSLHSDRLVLTPGQACDAIEIYELMLSNHAYFGYWNPVIDRAQLSAEYVLQLIESEGLRIQSVARHTQRLAVRGR